jgi:site-specific DNA-methyltransferase (adenine-specific)
MSGLPALKEDEFNSFLFNAKDYSLDTDFQFIYENGAIYNSDCVYFLKSIKDSSIDTIFADPPYNIKKATWDNIGSIDEYVNWSINWIKEASRILKDSGTLYIYVVLQKF